jgi:hypothetical protein
MHKQTLPVLLIAILLFTSCSHLYTPALYHADIVYQPKPASFDTVKSATYISAALGANTSADGQDLLTSGQINISRGYVFNGFNLAYGAFGVAGDYNNSTTSNSATNNPPNNFKDIFFGAVGARASANLYVNSGRFDFRYIGIEMAYSHEFGAYANFRQTIISSPNYYDDPRTGLFTVGLTSEILFHNVDNADFENGIRVFLGTTFGYDDLSNGYYTSSTYIDKLTHYVFPKATYFFKIKRVFGSIEAGSQIMLRFGYTF